MPELQPWERRLLEEARRGHLATIAADGRPHIVPVCFALVGAAIAVPVDEKPKRHSRLARLRNIDRDARVTFLADRYDDDWARLAWVRIDGEAAVIERGDVRPGALEALRERYPQYGDMALEARPLILIEARRVVSWRWRDDTTDDEES